MGAHRGLLPAEWIRVHGTEAEVRAAFGLLLRRSWYRPTLWIWAICITVTAGLAPVVWAGAGPMSGIAAAAATAVIAGIVVLLANIGAAPMSREP
jgi:hypothetical protein